MKLILNTVVLTTMAVAGFAAEQKLNFQVEFPFTVGKAVMPAGQYSVEATATRKTVVRLTHVVDGRSAFMNLPVGNQAGKADKKAQIVFRCAESGCSIAKVTNLLDGQVMNALSVKESRAKLVAIPLTSGLTKAD